VFTPSLHDYVVGFVSEYGSVFYSGMAETHMLRFESVQYQGRRIGLGIMCSTPNNSLGVLSGIAPLAERFMFLNFKYLVAIFYRLVHRLKRRLETLKELNMGDGIAYYYDVLPLNLVSSESFTCNELSLPALLVTHFVDDHMEKFSGVRASMYWWVAPRELLMVTSRYPIDWLLYTDGSLIDGCAGFVITRTEESGFGYKTDLKID
jgi:hypothetical protein